jgi:integrase
MASWDGALRAYVLRLAASGSITARQRARIIERWLAAVPDASGASLARYLRELEQAGYARGTVDRHRRIIQAACRACGLAAPPVPQWHFHRQEARRVALTREAVRACIAAVQTHGDSRTAAVWAIATTLGLRAAELAAIRPEDWRTGPDGVALWVRTAKGGQPRWHWLPPAVAAWAQQAPWPRTTPHALRAVFAAGWQAAFGAAPPPGTGWHAIRRALVRDLVAAGTPWPAVVRFLRWRSGGQAAVDLVLLYGTPTEEVGGPDGARPVSLPEASAAADAAIWARHPYVDAWAPPDAG